MPCRAGAITGSVSVLHRGASPHVKAELYTVSVYTVTVCGHRSISLLTPARRLEERCVSPCKLHPAAATAHRETAPTERENLSLYTASSQKNLTRDNIDSVAHRAAARTPELIANDGIVRNV